MSGECGEAKGKGQADRERKGQNEHKSRFRLRSAQMISLLNPPLNGHDKSKDSFPLTTMGPSAKYVTRDTREVGVLGGVTFTQK